MKQNRKVNKKMAKITVHSMNLGAIVVMVLIMSLLNYIANSRCQQLSNDIGKQHREIDKLKNEVVQESTRWEQMKAPDKLNIALLRHGLKMETPKAHQNVYLKPDGSPYPGQIAVTDANRRRQAPVASYRPSRRK